MVEVQNVYVPVRGAKRTPTGKRGGGLSRKGAVDLQVAVVNASLEGTGIPKEVIGKLIGACATQTGYQQGNDFSWMTSEQTGLMVPSCTINQLCASGGGAIDYSSALVACGRRKATIASGSENNHKVFHGQDLVESANNLIDLIKNFFGAIIKGPKIINDSLPKGIKLYPMGRYGDAIAKARNMSVSRLNDFGNLIQKRAAEAQRTGRFDDELVPVVTPYGIVRTDESIRPDTTLESLSKLPFRFGKNMPLWGLPFYPFTKLGTKKGFHTAGTSSQVSAAAAAMILTNGEIVREYDQKRLVKIIAIEESKTDSQDLVEHLLGPLEATEKALQSAGLKAENIDLWEINEAFAAVVLTVIDYFKLDISKVNVNGGAIALGHALGASGVRVPVTLIHEMDKRGARLGAATFCIGGGRGFTIIFELCDENEMCIIQNLPHKAKSFPVR